MSRSYLMPVVSVFENKEFINLPKYVNPGDEFSSLPYGVEGLALVTIPNFVIGWDKHDDVYLFPADLTQTLNDHDAAVLVEYLDDNDVPSDQIISGMPFVAALVTIAKIFVCAQYLSGQTGNAIFTSGVTLDSAFADSPTATITATQLSQQSQQSGVQTQGVQSQPLPPDPAPSPDPSPDPIPVQGPPVVALFDFTAVDPSATVGDTLDTVSQQFTDSIYLGSF